MTTRINGLAMGLALAIASPSLAQTTPPPASVTTPPPAAASSPNAMPPRTGTTAMPGSAQTSPAVISPAQTTQAPGAIISPPAATPPTTTQRAAAPVAGANSFTEAQARSRIEAAGYSQLANLRKDDAGIWHGQARHAGASVTVSMDFRGDVTSH